MDIVFCENAPQPTSCYSCYGNLTLNGSLDAGRWVMADYSTSGIDGVMTCIIGGQTYQYELSGEFQLGNCN